MRMPAIREIQVTEWIDQAWSLFEAHCEEIAQDMLLAPDLDAYCLLEDRGALLSLGAFEGDEIVGYSVNLITHNLHHANVTICQNDILYLREDKRQGATGLKLMRETERMAKERGAHMVIWHAKPETNLSGILPRMGYDVRQVCYARMI
jgi:predicted GNAT superfamily acetyltransferase